jgi:hypothetical protein
MLYMHKAHGYILYPLAFFYLRSRLTKEQLRRMSTSCASSENDEPRMCRIRGRRNPVDPQAGNAAPLPLFDRLSAQPILGMTNS